MAANLNLVQNEDTVVELLSPNSPEQVDAKSMLDPGYVSFFPPNVREVEDSDKNGVQNPNKKTAAVYLPAKTRQSSRIQDKGEMALKKAMDGKAKTKGISTSKPLPPPPLLNPLDTLASVCGFSLGPDETSRIANISLIQAKEEALLAIQKIKDKIESSVNHQQVSSVPNKPQIDSRGERSTADQSSKIEIFPTEPRMDINLLKSDQNEDSLLECQRIG